MFAAPMASPRRKYFTMRDKSEVVRMVTARLRNGYTHTACAAEFGVSPTVLRQWEQQQDMLVYATKVKKGALKDPSFRSPRDS